MMFRAHHGLRKTRDTLEIERRSEINPVRFGGSVLFVTDLSESAYLPNPYSAGSLSSVRHQFP